MEYWGGELLRYGGERERIRKEKPMLTALRTNQDLCGATDCQIYGSLPVIRKTYSVSENLRIFPWRPR